MLLCASEALFHHTADSQDRTGEGKRNEFKNVINRIKIASNIVTKLLNVLLAANSD
jgi:hypothetical protein